MTKLSNVNFTEAKLSYAKVQETAAAMRTEHDQVCAEIVATETELKELPLAHVPVEDLKAGILDFVEASGRRYGADKVRAAIASFARGHMSGMSGANRLGRPLRYCDIEDAISGTSPEMSWAQILSPDKSQFNDQVLYYFFAELVQEGLRRIMADMAPAELGYDAIQSDEIGTDRATRRVEIEDRRQRLADLIGRRDDLRGKLSALGFPVKGVILGYKST